MSTGISNQTIKSSWRGGGNVMKKIIVMGLVAILALGFAAVANAAYTADTDWLVYLKASDTVNANATSFNAGSQTGAFDGTGDGKDAAAAPAASGAAIIAGWDLGAGANNAGYSADRRLALTEGGTKTWGDIRLSVGSTYAGAAVKLIGWNATGSYDLANYLGADAGKGRVQLIVVNDITGTFAANEVLYTWDGLTNGASATPMFTKTFNNAQLLKSGYTTLKLVASVDSSVPPVVPEPGSFVALGSGLVSLVGFSIRRRK